jgi:hypothetical protein
MKGPTGNFPLGEAVIKGDKGGCFATFKRVPDAVLFSMDFGTALSFVALRPNDAVAMANLFRRRVGEEFGNLEYDVSTLPIVVKPNKRKTIVECRFPQTLEVLFANPEVFLAWADRLSQCALKLLN